MIRVIYVDDEEGLLEVGKSFLEQSGNLIVDTALSIRDAKELLHSDEYDAIISDYQMPGEDGIEFLKVLRSQGIRIPFILFTGKGREEVVIDALNSGADFYLQKGGNPRAQFVELEHKVVDAVERRRMERALIKNERILKRAHKLGQTGGWEYDLILKNGKVWGSEEAYAIFGFDRPGGGDTWWEDIEACVIDLTPARKAFKDLIEHGKKYNLTLEIHPTDGGPPHIINSIAEIERDQSGKAVKVIGLVRDITEQVVVRKRLEQSERKYRSIVEQSSNGVILVDHDGTVIDCNQSALILFGLSNEMLLNHHAWDLIEYYSTGLPIKDGHRALVKQMILEALRTGKGPFMNRKTEVDFLRPDGTVKRLEQNVFSIMTEKGFQIGAIIRDITTDPAIEQGHESRNERSAGSDQRYCPICLQRMKD